MVIIDEAHNLIDTVQSIYSVSLTVSMIVTAHKQLLAYFDKYKSRLNGQNMMYIQQMLSLLQALRRFTDDPAHEPSQQSKATESRGSIWTINDFVQGLRIDNINMFKIHNYLAQSRLAQKVGRMVQMTIPILNSSCAY